MWWIQTPVVGRERMGTNIKSSGKSQLTTVNGEADVQRENDFATKGLQINVPLRRSATVRHVY